MKIGIVDSGGPEYTRVGGAAFLLRDSQVMTTTAVADRLGHGRLVDHAIRSANPDATLIHAQVFVDKPVTTAAQVAAALNWLAKRSVDVVCLSLGLPVDRAPLRRACAQLQQAGIHLIAASPAQGRKTYPAHYQGVIAATGDARCKPGEISSLYHHGKTVFGAWCASPEQTGQQAGGASIGCAHLTAMVAQVLQQQGPLRHDALIQALDDIAMYHGREYREMPCLSGS